MPTGHFLFLLDERLPGSDVGPIKRAMCLIRRKVHERRRSVFPMKGSEVPGMTTREVA